MQTRRLSTSVLAAVVLTVLTQASCNVLETQPSSDLVTRNLTLALGSQADIQADSCRWVVEKASLVVGGRTLDSLTVPKDSPVTFPNVELETGSILLEVIVLSNNNRTVYSGSTTVEIKDNFSITLHVLPVAPVMKVCLPEGEQKIQIENRGLGTVSWSVDTVPSGQLCAARESLNCVDIDTAGTTDSTTPTTLEYRVHSDDTRRSFELIISSAEGDIREIEINPQPVGNEPKARGRNPNGIPRQWVAWFGRG